MNTGNIQEFITTYSDDKLAALFCHTKDGKLGYGSCCCLIGIPTADHALQEAPGLSHMPADISVAHYYAAKRSSRLAQIVEQEFCLLGRDDVERRAALLPLIEAEMANRDQSRRVAEVVEAIAQV